MGSRSVEKGNAAIADILKQFPQHKDNIRLVQCDTSAPASIAEAARQVKEHLGDKKLHAIVNNAGVMRVDADTLIKTNIYGPKWMTDAFIDMIDSSSGRIVNVSSGIGPSYVGKRPKEDAAFWINTEVTWDQIEARIKSDAKKEEGFGLYGFSKACLNLLTLATVKTHPHILSSCVSPGYVQTNMTGGNGSLTAEQGTASTRHCLF